MCDKVTQPVSKQWTTVWSDNPEQAKPRPRGLWLCLQHYNHKKKKIIITEYSELGVQKDDGLPAV